MLLNVDRAHRALCALHAGGALTDLKLNPRTAAALARVLRRHGWVTSTAPHPGRAGYVITPSGERAMTALAAVLAEVPQESP